jgi:hypothetical protein
MSASMLKSVSLIVVAAACAISVCLLRAQQTQGSDATQPSQGSSAGRQQTKGDAAGSSWGAAMARPSARTARATSQDNGSSWTAGKGNIPIGLQPGGVWRDGSTFGAVAAKPAASNGANPLAASSPAGLPGSTSGIGLDTPAAAAKLQGPRSEGVKRASLAAGKGALVQHGLRANGRGRTAMKRANQREQGGRNGQGRQGKQSKLQRQLGASSSSTSLNSSMDENSILKPLATPASLDPLSNGASSPLGDSPK